MLVQSLSVLRVSAEDALSLEKRFVSKCFVRCMLFAARLTTHESFLSADVTATEYNYNYSSSGSVDVR